TPGGILRLLENLREIARIHQLLPGVHIHQRRRRRCKERRVRRAADLCEATEHLHVGRRVIELIVPNDATVGCAAWSAILLFVNFLEKRTLVPSRTLELPQDTSGFLF